MHQGTYSWRLHPQQRHLLAGTATVRAVRLHLVLELFSRSRGVSFQLCCTTARYVFIFLFASFCCSQGTGNILQRSSCAGWNVQGTMTRQHGRRDLEERAARHHARHPEMAVKAAKQRQQNAQVFAKNQIEDAHAILRATNT